MPARKPEEVDHLFSQAYAAHDVDAAMALYEPGASLLPEPGRVVTGTAAIREALSGFFSLKASFHTEVLKVIHAGDVALVYAKWTLSGSGPDGKPIDMARQSTEVMRRQSDGTWLLVVDDPFGGPT